MIGLINGRGQLGEALSKLVKEKKSDEDAIIYHTWNVWEKEEEPQRKEFEKFKRFVDENLDNKVVFTSTNSKKETFYTHYKQLSEAYLISNHRRGYVIKLPNLIGKGICEMFREGKAEPSGIMELMTIEGAAREVMRLVDYEGLVRSFGIEGHKIPATLVKELILFGAKKSREY